MLKNSNNQKLYEPDQMVQNPGYPGNLTSPKHGDTNLQLISLMLRSRTHLFHTAQLTQQPTWRNPRGLRNLPAGSGFSLLGLLEQRCPLSRVQVPATRDVWRRGDPVVMLQVPSAPGRVSGSVRVVAATEPEPVEAIWPSGGHEEERTEREPQIREQRRAWSRTKYRWFLRDHADLLMALTEPADLTTMMGLWLCLIRSCCHSCRSRPDVTHCSIVLNNPIRFKTKFSKCS
ncbi:hypothetical protein XENOCAPTIV_008478 [Xenoophorus captivus]|uniref:Uncharacterized protein n=1 Tax=Xenoophorus captivus TaxID=1517983 RepID=A0ABV0RQY5_9TELE